MPKASVGKSIPCFKLSGTNERTITEKDFSKQLTILYFYPKDNTPGCTQEGQDFRDNYKKFQKLNTQILGVSRDSIKTHENFKAKHDFQFDLISDPDEKLCKIFDVIKMKNMYGKQVMGIERSTFLINKKGILIKEWRKIKVKDHVADVLASIKELS